MSNRINRERFKGVWSASSTPFTERMEIDTVSVKRMVEHQIKLGIKGIFLCGTAGEGPWMTNQQKRILVREVVKHNKGRMLISAQVTENSAARILDNIYAIKEEGADIAIVAPPYFLQNATPKNILNLYLETIRKSPLPIGIYLRGTHSPVVIPNEVLKVIFKEKKVITIKDSSNIEENHVAALEARIKRPELALQTGMEFECVKYLKMGYDGLLLGGAIFHGYLAGQIINAVRTGDIERAEKLQQYMNRMMYEVFGGKKLSCWLSGQKRLLVEIGLFRSWKNYLNYPLTKSCVQSIKKVVKRDANILMPWKHSNNV